MIYNYLPKSAGLRRITLHKSQSNGDKQYVLMCECANLLQDFTSVAKLLPALKARLCGCTGVYRSIFIIWKCKTMYYKCLYLVRIYQINAVNCKYNKTNNFEYSKLVYEYNTVNNGILRRMTNENIVIIITIIYYSKNKFNVVFN